MSGGNNYPHNNNNDSDDLQASYSRILVTAAWVQAAALG